MKHFLFLPILFLSLSLKAEEIYLGIGESHTLTSSPHQPLVVQRKGILSIKDLGHKLILTGKKLGETRVSQGGPIHHFKVLPIARYRSLESLKQWVQRKRGPEIKVENRQVYLKGRLLKLSDFIELKNFMGPDSDFQTAIEFSSSLKEEFINHFSSILKQNNLTPGAWSFQPEIRLIIPASEKAKKSYYDRILKPYGVQLRIDSSQIKSHSLIELKVYVAHIKKNFMRQFGVRWPSQISAQVLPTDPTQMDSFALSLDAMESEGWGQTLATPVLITDSGQWAEFHSGGEFPVQSSTQFNNTVEWKQYGLSLKARPTSNGRNELRVEIDMEISSIDSTQSSGGIPALNRNQLKTQISMTTPRPFLLSGFVQKSTNEGDQGLPWLRQVPLFASLFSTGQIFNTEFELVFILIPRFYES